MIGIEPNLWWEIKSVQISKLVKPIIVRSIHIKMIL